VAIPCSRRQPTQRVQDLPTTATLLAASRALAGQLDLT
jgi:hypothetical protein